MGNCKYMYNLGGCRITHFTFIPLSLQFFITDKNSLWLSFPSPNKEHKQWQLCAQNKGCAEYYSIVSQTRYLCI